MFSKTQDKQLCFLVLIFLTSFLSCRCRKGEYFSAECTCKRCEIQPSNCTVSVGGYSYYNGCEGDGVSDDSVCGQTRFFCGAACKPDEFLERKCNSRINFERKCKKCREPEDGEYMQRGCLPTLDADIHQCSSPKTCIPSALLNLDCFFCIFCPASHIIFFFCRFNLLRSLRQRTGWTLCQLHSNTNQTFIRILHGWV